MEPLYVTINESKLPKRLDKALSEGCDLSRSYLQQLIGAGHVFLNGAAVLSPTAKVKAGEVYELRIPEAEPLALEPVAMELEIHFEDAHLLVINKPAGLTVHPAASTREPTLVHGLLAHCAESLSGIGGVARPGIVHRLDKDTSGLMLVAKTDAAHQHLSAQLKDRSLSRRYDALCWGTPAPLTGCIDAPIGRNPKDRLRMAVVSQGGKEARTHYETIERFAFASHIRCKLETGRTHQIRVHMQHIGHGLIGDASYGQRSDKRLKNLGLHGADGTETLAAFGRQALHASAIRFIHPHTGEPQHHECPLPSDMAELLTSLKCLQNT